MLFGGKRSESALSERITVERIMGKQSNERDEAISRAPLCGTRKENQCVRNPASLRKRRRGWWPCGGIRSQYARKCLADVALRN